MSGNPILNKFLSSSSWRDRIESLFEFNRFDDGNNPDGEGLNDWPRDVSNIIGYINGQWPIWLKCPIFMYVHIDINVLILKQGQC